MGAMRKAGVWLGLIEDDEDRRYADDDRRYSDRGYSDRYADDDYDDPADDDEPVRARPRSGVRTLGRAPVSAPMTQDNLALAPQVQLRERAVVADEDDHNYRITTMHPTTYNDARAIGEHFRGNVPVIMNLSEMDEGDAKRLVDFAAGLAFGLRGTIERVTNRVFLLSPANVQVTAEDKAKIAEGGFFNQS